MYRVLLVDDEEMVTKGLSRFVPWESLGFQVAGTATSTARALTFLEGQMVDLVITDVQMPVQSGLDLIRILKEQYPTVKTVVLSGYAEFSYAQQALRWGSLDYLTKPVNFDAMKQILTKVRGILDEESRQSEPDGEFQEMFAQTLILDYLNDMPYDPQRASACLNTGVPITVVRLTPWGGRGVDGQMRRGLQSALAPCHVVALGSSELLAVVEGPQDRQSLSDRVRQWSEDAGGMSAGISLEQPGYEQTQTGAQQAAKAMRYQNARSDPGITFFADVRDIFLSTGAQSQRQEDKIRSLARLMQDPRQRRSLPEHFTQTLYAMEGSGAQAVMDAKRLCTELLVELDGFVQTQSLPDYPRHAMLSQILIQMLSAGNLSQINGRMTAYLEQLVSRLEQREEPKPALDLIDRVKAYIGAHYAQNLTLGLLADNFFVSPVYLSRLFKKKTGTNFVEYLTALRIEKAKEFLSDPELKIYHVAERVGYENPRYFARLFREITGMSPQEYRNLQTVQSPDQAPREPVS